MKKFLIVLVLVLALACLFAACDKEETLDTVNGNENTDQSATHTHSYGEWSATRAATCTAKGEEKRTCACGESETREIAMLSHTFGAWSVTRAATCTAKGEEKRTCACGASEARGIAMANHVYGEWEVAVPVTCYTPGTRERACIYCMVTEFAVIPQTNAHSYDTNNRCTECNQLMVYTAGLEYILNPDGVSYMVSGTSVTDANVVIPPYHQGKPITKIDEYAFLMCHDLTSVVLPATLTTIAPNAFCDCKNLSYIEIPASVTSIGNHAFQRCTQITDVVIPQGVTSIGFNPFSGCSALKSITVEEGNAIYYSRDNCVIEQASKSLIVGCKSSVIPADGSVTSIAPYAFYRFDALTRIEIPACVTSIGKGALSGCGFESVVIPNAVTQIPDFLFFGCSNLQSVEMSDEITSIGKGAFQGCSSLKTFEIPATITYIGKEAFLDCFALESVYFEVTDGWFCSIKEDFSTGYDMNAAKLANPATAATYVRHPLYGYADCYWKRTLG